MSAHESIIDKLPLEGEKVDVSKFEKPIRILAGVGGIAMLISLIILAFTPARAPMAYSWLWAFYFFVTISIGGLFWVLLHNASNSGWGVVVRRVSVGRRPSGEPLSLGKRTRGCRADELRSMTPDEPVDVRPVLVRVPVPVAVPPVDGRSYVTAPPVLRRAES